MRQAVLKFPLKDSDYYLHLFHDPFLKDAYESKSGFYYVGHGHLFVPINIKGKIPLVGENSLNSSYFLEFGIYANEETLNLPNLRIESGSLTSLIAPSLLSKFNQLQRWFADPERSIKFKDIKKNCLEFLKDERLRRAIGDLTISEYLLREDNPLYLEEILNQYHRQPDNIINFPAISKL